MGATTSSLNSTRHDDGVLFLSSRRVNGWALLSSANSPCQPAEAGAGSCTATFLMKTSETRDLRVLCEGTLYGMNTKEYNLCFR